MNLILWRHAEAQIQLPGQEDSDRVLTSKGQKQAKRMGQWLDRQLPASTLILVSPARRTTQTAEALGRKFKISPALAPDRSVEQLLEEVQWPRSDITVLVVGHQPTLGMTVAQLLGMVEKECPIKRGAVWWLRQRVRNDRPRIELIAVQSPDKL